MNYKLYMAYMVNYIKDTRTGFKLMVSFWWGYTNKPLDTEEWKLDVPMNLLFSNMGVNIEYGVNDTWFHGGLKKLGYDMMQENTYVPDFIKAIPIEEMEFVPKLGAFGMSSVGIDHTFDPEPEITTPGPPEQNEAKGEA